MLLNGKTGKDTYENLLADRAPYLDRAKQVSALTLPHLITEEGTRGPALPTPYQSVGARGVKSLASKLMLTLFPPSQSVFRLQADPGLMDKLGGGQVATEVQSAFADIEQAVSGEVEALGLRPHIYESLLHREVAGNVILYLDESGKSRVFPLPRFVVKRDPSGNLMVVITKECVSPVLLPEHVQRLLKPEGGLEENREDMNTADIFTVVHRSDKTRFTVWQEINGIFIPGTVGSYEEDELPWIVLRSAPIAGESYSYGHAADSLGDLSSLEGLMKALVEASAASARIVFLVNPASQTRISELNAARNGQFVTGLPDDIMPLKVDKAADMTVCFNAIERLTQSLGYAFLLNQSVQRKGERVTAEEIRFLAQELDDVQAGSYALLSQELQLRLVKVILSRLKKAKKIPALDPRVAKPTIITGLEALGRGHDLVKLDTLIQGAAALLGPDHIAQYLNVGDYLKRRGVALGVQLEGLIRSEEEVQQQQAQAAQSQMIQDVAPEAVRQVGAMAQQQAGARK